MTRTRAVRRVVYAAVALSLIASSLLVASPASAARSIRVYPGQSIQAAVRHAQPGDTIIVHRGVYHQTVQIRKNNLTLRGRHAVLKEPAHVRQNICNANLGPTGICFVAKKAGPTGEVIVPRKARTGYRLHDP